MHKETFLPIGIVIVTLQRELWECQIRIVMAYVFINCDLAFRKCNLSWLGNFCWLLAASGRSWLLMVTFVSFWPHLAVYGRFWLLLAASGSSWLLLAATGRFWPLLAASGRFWPLLAAPSRVWPRLAASGLV